MSIRSISPFQRDDLPLPEDPFLDHPQDRLEDFDTGASDLMGEPCCKPHDPEGAAPEYQENLSGGKEIGAQELARVSYY